MREIHDMPKLSSPFVREVVGGAYVVTPAIAPGFEWVFDDPTVIATEKLHGTNVSILVEDGQLVGAWNRDTRVPFFNRGKTFITEGLLESFKRGYVDQLPDGQHFGELVGPNLHGDPHEVGKHVWLPFSSYVRRKLAISDWFEKTLFSLFHGHWHGHPPDESKFCEGVVFVRPSTGEMAKLRKDMFPWWKGARHKDVEAA